MINRVVRWIGLGTASVFAIAATSVAAVAQDNAEAVDDASLQAIIVTGSRVQRDGYSAPSPLTVVGAEAIESAAVGNVADFINKMPQLVGSSTLRVGNGATSTGTAGLNLLNLRGLGSNRVLVLIDGQRVAPSTQTGAVDINNIPSALLQRVDIVTGGASAAYGSDAVAGVVNFIVDERFEGIKANVMGGITDRGDNRNFLVSAAFGHRFADDRAVILFSAEHQHEDGIPFLDINKRDWYNYTYLVPNPAYVAGNGQPRQIVSPNVYYNNVAQGGVITTTALANTMFGAGGTPLPFVRGTTAGNFMIGGNEWNEGWVTALTPKIDRTNVWGRFAYEFSPAIKATLEGSYGTAHTINRAAYQRYAGNLTIDATNPFLPQSIRDQAAASNITSFRYGYSSYDLGVPINDIERSNYRIIASLSGALASNWNWQAYYQYGRSDIRIELQNTTNVANFNRAIDAVTSNGRIVCRSTVTNPTNGCVPLNIFGIGVADPAAVRYVKGVAWQDQELTQEVWAASINGEPFALWAGPVSLAVGIEHRKESATAVGDALSQTNGWYTGNFKSNAGSYSVTEGFLETVVPLLKEASLGSADFNAAVRVTDYSTSGNVVTWKAGLTWDPIDDIRFRGMVSRDIRAPNISELFVAGATQAVDVIDPANGNSVFRITQVTDGNLALKPEKADTFGAGVVVKPRFLPGFQASVDYYDINLKGAITSLSVNEIAARCAGGESQLCSFITRNASNIITEIRRVPINVATLRVRGIDFDASYRMPLDTLVSGAAGEISILFRANRAFEYSFTNNGVSNEAVGENGGPNANPAVPKWQTYMQVAYQGARIGLNLARRTVSAGVYDVDWVSGVDIDNNRIDGASYLDLGGSYKLFGDGRSGAELYFKIDNLLDKDPPVAANVFSSGLQTNPGLYDVIGRDYRVGVRFRF